MNPMPNTVRYAATLTATTIAVTLVAGAGCGTVERNLFPSQALGAEGQPLFIEDLQEVVQDAAASDDAKRNDLLDLGVGNEEFIAAIVENGLPDANTPTIPPADDADGGTTNGGNLNGSNDGSNDGSGDDSGIDLPPIG